ncbi:NAD(P)/FAD-dependent oxidoreductase [Mobilicoccus pelagius]|uniref:Putative NADH dehydrogenase n=1 Tax=Mobilicoccus pelagius NBRC 104925 TaxID=1089455 RepID=H5UV20_9MICO|nr:NAD(P)/FAD-dependent oxidoreductase [Mobilicoccus pelagius]GAB49578.1 putative NADH dehydrogenase [Mobilicoccus pelagius NBRC 104925]
MASRVVIVGAGFAGQHAYHELAEAGYEVTLVDRHPYTTFQPLLYQVATGGLNPGDIAFPLRRFVSRSKGRTKFRRATVTGIDTENKRVLTNRGEPIPYDTLVLAQGAGPNFFGIPGAKENARTIYSRAEALAVRDLLFSGLEQMTTQPDRERRFTVLVVGGGATGVEMAGTLAEMKSEAIPVVYPELSQDSFRVVLAEMADTLVAPFDPRLQRYTLHQLRKRGVDIRLGTAVKEVRPDSVDFADGSTMDVDLVIWASGFGAHPEVSEWGMPQGRGGRIEVEPNLQVKGHPDIYAIGDAAIEPGSPLPQLAQPAMQMGSHVGREIVAADKGLPPTPFGYDDKGTMATIGRNAAVAQFPSGRTVTGFPAWALWVGVHLATLLGGRNRLQAMVNTAFRYFAWPQSATNILGDTVVEDVQLDQSAGRPELPQQSE